MSVRQPGTAPTTSELLSRMIALQEQTNVILERQLVPLQQEANALRAQSNALTQQLLSAKSQSGPQTAGPVGVFAVDPSPNGLTSITQATGDTTFGSTALVSFPVYVPAGGEYLLIMLPPSGYSIQIKRKLTAESDTYIAEVELAEFMVNGQSVLQEGLAYIINAPKVYESAVDLIVGQQGLQALFVNASPYDATLFISGESLHLTDAYVNHYLEPALDYAYTLTEQAGARA